MGSQGLRLGHPGVGTRRGQAWGHSLATPGGSPPLGGGAEGVVGTGTRILG